MAEKSTVQPLTKCRKCGFEAPADSGEWVRVEHPTLGRVTRCPDCGSTDLVDRP